MRVRSGSLVLVALLTVAACGSDDDGGGSGSGGSTPTSSGATPSSGEAPGDATGAPNTDTFAPPADVAALLQPDAATALAALGFPEGWVLPDGGADAISGVLVRYSQGDDLHSTFRTAYTVPAGELDAAGAEWVQRFDESLGIDVPLMAAHVTSDNGEANVYTSSGDAEPGAPSLDIEVIKATDAPDTLTVVAEYQTIDRSLPALAFPSDVDPTMPALDGCTAERFDADLVAYTPVSMPADEPTYTIWWEGDCPGGAFDAAAAWANSNGGDVDVATTTSFTRPITLASGAVLNLTASKLDGGGTALTLIVEQPVS